VWRKFNRRFHHARWNAVVYAVRDANGQCRSEFAVGGGSGEDRARKDRNAWRNCNGIQTSPKSNDSGEKTMAEKTKLVADFISAENVGPNERSEFALGLAVALLLQLSTIEQIQNALATIKGGYS
jgi:hypothetical protein